MIAVAEAVSPVVKEKCVEEVLSPRVLELRTKIHDEEYVNVAIQRIAMVISRELVRPPEELKYGGRH